MTYWPLSTRHIVKLSQRSNSVHNWLLDLEHIRQHAQKFLGSVNKYLISQNICNVHYLYLLFLKIRLLLLPREIWGSRHISDYWGQVNYATRDSYEVWDVSRDTRDIVTPGDTPCHGSRHAARDTFLTATILSLKSDDDFPFLSALLVFMNLCCDVYQVTINSRWWRSLINLQ